MMCKMHLARNKMFVGSNAALMSLSNRTNTKLNKDTNTDLNANILWGALGKNNMFVGSTRLQLLSSCSHHCVVPPFTHQLYFCIPLFWFSFYLASIRQTQSVTSVFSFANFWCEILLNVNVCHSSWLSHEIRTRDPYATLRADDIEGSDIEPTTLRADDFEGRRLWGQTTLRANICNVQNT